MARLFSIGCLLVAFGLVIGTSGADDDAKKKRRGKFDPKVMFKKMDKDNDGAISEKEFFAIMKIFAKKRFGDKLDDAKLERIAGKRFSMMDGDKNKKVTFEEFTEFREKMKKRKGKGFRRKKRDN